MLDASRRGAMAAYDVFCALKQNRAFVLPLTPKEVSALAYRVYCDMEKQGYAHLEPQEDFLSGFAARFSRALSDAYSI